MNNSVMKCCICNNEKSGEFITINDKKYHLCCIEQIQNNWNELKKWLEETIKQYDNVGLKFKKENNFECASRSYDYLKQYQTMLNKMQEMEQGKDE